MEQCPPTAESSPGPRMDSGNERSLQSIWDITWLGSRKGCGKTWQLFQRSLGPPSEGACAPGIQKSLLNILPWIAQALPTSNPMYLRQDISLFPNVLQLCGISGHTQWGPISGEAAVKSIFGHPKGGSSKPDLDTHSRKKFQ